MSLLLASIVVLLLQILTFLMIWGIYDNVRLHRLDSRDYHVAMSKIAFEIADKIRRSL